MIKKGGAFRILGGGLYHTIPNPNNILTVIKLDTVNQIISGIFQFDAINEDDMTDTVKIREGRFDVTFTY